MRGFHVLFAEDDFLLNLDISETLREHGFDVESVYCGGAAIEAIGRSRGLVALVTDIDLGSGPNGFDVARRARAAYPELPIVFISGAMAGRHLEAGIAGSVFIPKPVRPSDIAKVLDKVRHLAAAA